MPNFSIPLSGLTAESTALAAIANNLANQNTTGYQTNSVLFSDLFYQNMGTTGSGDPIQLGSGALVSSTPTNFTQGSVQATGINTDVAIQGNGFFVVQDGGVTSYTRDGTFSVDNNNDLVTAEGQQVMGYPAVAGTITTGGGLTPLQLGAGTTSPPTATGNVDIQTNLNAAANVGDPAYSTPVTIYDSLGNSHTLTFSFSKTASNTWSYQLSIPPGDLNPVNGQNQTGILATGTLTFDGNGNLIGPVDGNGKLVTNIPVTATSLADGATNLTFNWNLVSGTTPNITQVAAAASSTSSAKQDGASSGTLAGFSIGADGTVTGTFTNGKTAALGQVALASFANEEGLQRVGNTDYNETLASGQAVVGAAGTGGRGTLAGGSLELSNVDISTEFSNLIVAQRAFEANAKTVTTFDQIMEDTINIKQG